MRILPEQSLAVLIDVQERLYPHMQQSDILRKRLSVLIKGLLALDVPIMMTEQYKKGLGETIDPVLEAFGEACPQGAMRPEKKHFSVLDHETAAAEIHRRSPKFLLLFGIETHVCVLQTALDAKASGFEAVVVVDAVSSRFEIDKQTALTRMQQEGIRLTTVESLLFELCRVSGSPTFKTISGLVK